MISDGYKMCNIRPWLLWSENSTENNHQKEEPNGYDSDPELYNNSKMYDKNASDLKKSQK